MKSLNLFFTYIVSFMVLFFTLSLIGLLWVHSYWTIIGDVNWFVCYAVLIGWWTSIFPAAEYYKAHEQYFKMVF